MTEQHDCPVNMTNLCSERHWAIYWILIVCSVVMITGRVMHAGGSNGKGDTPFFCANDKSRWCTIRTLADEGTYEIDSVVDSVIEDPEGRIHIEWNTIDKVVHQGDDGKMHQYSSKPTLLPTIMAGGYKLIRTTTGLDLENDTFTVARLMLILFSVLPWIAYLWFLAAMLDKIGVRDWTRYFVVGVAGFGTCLSTFAVSLNNHVPAAISVMIALYCIAEMYRIVLVGEKKLRWRDFWMAGLFAAFAAANELPALSFVGMAGLLCLYKSPRKTFLGFVPGALIVVAAFFGTNWLAHGDWRPAYTHRGDGAVLSTVDFDKALAKDMDSGQLPSSITSALANALENNAEIKSPEVETGRWPTTPENVSRWVVRDRVSANQAAITHTDGSDEFEIRRWDNWYDYPGSYWASDRKSEIDRGQSSRQLYAFHVLFGHHGIFSLTPIWILAFAGMFSLVINDRLNLRWLGLTSIIITVVVTGFYIMRPELDRNYGGYTSALRWLFWLAPLWLMSMLPVVDWLGRTKKGRAFCFLLLGLSAVSALYAAGNPWVHPWLYEVWDVTGLPR